MDDLIKAVSEVTFFVKHNEFPEIHSKGFIELTELLNAQEIALKNYLNDTKL